MVRRSSRKPRRLLALVVAASWGVPAAARGDEASLRPRLPAPLVLPELTHPRTDVSSSWAVGRGDSELAGRPDAALALLRLAVEGSVVDRARHVYAGVTYSYGAALTPDGALPVDGSRPPEHASGTSGALGNVEPHVRSIFPVTPELAVGFVLGAVVPTATIDRHGPSRSATLAAASIEPTDWVHFLPGRFALRPAGDVRVVRGPVVVQVRQGLDMLVDEAGIDQVRVAARVLAHVGVTPTRWLELSMEGSQIYFFFTEDPPLPVDPSLPADQRALEEKKNAAYERQRISDDRRTAITLGPSARVSFADVDVGVGLVTNVFSPLSPALGGLLAGRFSLVVHFK